LDGGRAEVVLTDRVPIPNTHRNVWPGTTPAGALSSESEVILTAWLRPKAGVALDAQRARSLGATPPARRAYVHRSQLAREWVDNDDLEALRRYCARYGIEIVETHWRSATISGPLPKSVDAFGATVAVHETSDNRRFRHRSQSLHAPADVAAAMTGVFGLHQWPRSQKLGSLQRHATPLLARDVAARYQFPDADGSGQTIGVIQLRGVFKPDDFERCMRAQGLAPPAPILKRVDDAALAHELATTQDLEAALDVQIIASLAPKARVVVYEAPDDERGVLDAVRAAIFDEEYAPSVLSISYGWPEYLWTPAALDVLDDLFTAAALAGITVFCSSGDNGAELDGAGKPHVLSPASCPFTVACGATVIAGNEEQAWENGGGGFSERFDPPSWQDRVQATASQYGVRAGRGVPDVAAQELPGYYVVMDGVELAMGGTSAVAPVWAALTARINQRLGVPAGFFSPILYERAANLFTTVTSGSNGFFRAAAGWNPCTGLGVPMGTAIERALREP
jgi:kumamolisin